MALRTPLSVTPHLYMGDSTGRPLDNGVVYFGEQDKDPEFYPINLFSDDALTLPLAQPVHTKGGYLYDKGDMVEPHAKEIIYSVKVLDSYGRKVFYKGAMMRNSWNDDVIQQINQAITDSQQDVAAAAAIAVQNAINNTAVEGGVLADTFVTATANGEGQVARTQRSKNNDVIGLKDFGAVGDGVADDTAAVQAALTYASQQKVRLSVDGKFRLTQQVGTNTFYGFSSLSSGRFIIDFDGDAFKFSGTVANAAVTNVDFEFKVATTINSSAIVFEFQYHIMGLKFDFINLIGFSGCGWTFLRVLGKGSGGFFGGFLFSNVRSYHMYCDVMYDTVSWANSATFFNNFKFYGDYGLYIKEGASLTDSVIQGWYGQEATKGIVYAEGRLAKSSIASMVNWDNRVVALYLGKTSESNIVSNLFPHEIEDLGYTNHINTDNNRYLSNTNTAIASSFFTESAKLNKASFDAVFPTTIASGNYSTMSGAAALMGNGLNMNGFWIETNPETTGEDETTTPAGNYILDSTDTDKLKSAPGIFGRYERYAHLRMFTDFYLTSIDLDDYAFYVGIGNPDKLSNRTTGTFLTNVGDRFKLVDVSWTGVISELEDFGVMTRGRHQIQFMMRPYQWATDGSVHFNNKYMTTLAATGTSRRPLIKIRSVEKTTILGLIHYDARINISSQMK